RAGRRAAARRPQHGSRSGSGRRSSGCVRRGTSRRRQARHAPAGLRGLPGQPPWRRRRGRCRGRAPDAARRPRPVAATLSPAPDDLMTRPLLEIEGLSKSFGGVAAVDRVSLALEPGRIYGLIGPNGSGKTTLFHCVTGVERRDAGRVRFNGERIDGLEPHAIARRGIGRTFQIIRVFPELTALENLLVVTRGSLAGAEARARELLRFVKLDGLVHEYAGN